MTPEPQIKDYLPPELLAKLEEILSQQLRSLWERWFNQIPKQTPPVSFEEEKDDCFRVNATVGKMWIGTFNVAEKNGRFIMSAEYHNSEGMGNGGGDYYSMDVATEAGKDWIKKQWGRTWQQYLEGPTA
jgi:hypothetical protein